MRIRAITIGQKIPYLIDNKNFELNLESNLQKFNHFNNDLTERFKDINIDVQTKRLCSQPILSYDQQLYEKNLNETLNKIHEQLAIVENLILNHGIDYFASCAVLADEQILKYGVYEKLLLNEVPQFIKKRDAFFTSLHVASSENGINLSALRSGAKIIKNLSEPDPFKNLNFCVSSNISPDTPFFPAAYHMLEKPAFSIALEMADEVIKVFEASKNVHEAQIKLREHFEQIYENLVNICEIVAKTHNIEFHGIDFSPAPYPLIEKSIGKAIEMLNYEYFGAHGSLLGVALIKNAIPKKDKIIGFSGFMPSVLEDFVIAKNLAENNFNLDTLLLYATMCGTGLDCVPLPGDITEKELFYILLDICTISLRLNKPLTARLMPIPGKKAGDEVKFNFEYFAPSKVMEIRRLKNTKTNDIFSQKIKNFNFLK
ncbi:MAG: DUF711 family protein [Candidatus Lokiarchaeota archaeon]|nr:DUF711 family protein [Candidatus Lokiarchaeota archaeon]